MKLPEPGNVFAHKYRIVRPLAKGGMGTVYVARHETTELAVALKLLSPDVLRRDEAVERFELEAKVSAKVKSDHIVQVFDAGFDEESGMPFLVMELLEGKSLQELVRDRGPLEPPLVANLIEQVARGLGRAHQFKDQDGVLRPIVHRDLKPENLFVTRRDNGEPLLKILDFGIAKVLSESTLVSQNIKGTPLYIASEQAMGQVVSPRTDIWALGLVAYFLLTGEPYWRTAKQPGRNISALLTEITVLPIVPPRKRQQEVGSQVRTPKPFDAWFLKCVNRDINRRFASAEEAATALKKALSVSNAQALSEVDLGPTGAVSSPPVAEASTQLMTSTAPVSATLRAIEHPAAEPREHGASVRRAPRLKSAALGVAGLLLLVLGVVFILFRHSPTPSSAAAAPSSRPLVSRPPPPRAERLHSDRPSPSATAHVTPSRPVPIDAGLVPKPLAPPPAVPVPRAKPVARARPLLGASSAAPNKVPKASKPDASEPAPAKDPFFDRRR